MSKKSNRLAYKQVRAVWNDSDQKWYFVVADVVKVITKALNKKEYTKKLRKYDKSLARDWSQFVKRLAVDTNGGKQTMNCATAPCLLRIVLSIPSPRAKLFQQWINSLPINPYEPREEIELSPDARFDFYKTVKNLLHWFKKREQYALINEQRPPFKQMNELEVIFLLLEEDDILYRKKLYTKKGYSKKGYFNKMLKMRKKQ